MGKRQRHSQFIGYTPDELRGTARDKARSKEERLKVIAELKYQKLRNRQKRSK